MRQIFTHKNVVFQEWNVLRSRSEGMRTCVEIRYVGQPFVHISRRPINGPSSPPGSEDSRAINGPLNTVSPFCFWEMMHRCMRIHV